MELDIFMKGLESSLVKRGIPSEVAKRHAAALRRTFTEDDLTEIRNIRHESEIDEIADGIASILNKNKNRTSSQAAANAGEYTAQASHHSEAVTDKQPIPRHTVPEHAVQNSADFFVPQKTADKTPKGTAIFWTVLILTLPITLGLIAGILGIFSSVYIALIIAIIGLVAALIAVVACGAGISLIGIIYGITQLFNYVPAGIYEIGLGVMIAGIAVFTAILLYNAAVRFLPWIMRWLSVFFVFVFDRIKYGFYVARRECYKL